MATSGKASVGVIPGITMVAEWNFDYQNAYNNQSHVYTELKLVSDGSASISGAGVKWMDYHFGQFGAHTTRSVDVGAGETVVVYSASQVVRHEEDGTLSSVDRLFHVSIEFGDINGIDVGTKEIYTYLNIPQILRPVTISVSNAILGEESVIAVSRYVDTLTHTITWSCGENSGTVCEKSQNDSEAFAAPIDFSSLNTAGDTVIISFVAITYDGENETGRRSYSFAYSMPAYVAPTCVFSIADSLDGKYVDYVQNKSSLQIVTTPTIAYGANIVSCQVFVDGAVYSGIDVTTDPVSSVGAVQVVVKVTDSRGRSYSDAKTINVIAYTPPSVIRLITDRTNADGSDNEQGEYVKATFSAAVTSLNSKNSAVYKLGYKKSAYLGYTEIDVSEYTGEYSLADIFRIFAADTGSSYDVRLSITDDFHTTIYEAKAPTGFTTFHVPASGHGFSFGKVSEIEDLLDVAFVARFAGFMHPELDDGVDFNDVIVPNTYSCSDASKAGYINAPFTEGEFVLEVMATSNGLIQKAIACEPGAFNASVRCQKDEEWGDWTEIGGSPSAEDLLTYEDNAYGGQTVTIGV